ncbi:hypothetical protein GCM10027406_16070 [Leifsonia lichenia]
MVESHDGRGIQRPGTVNAYLTAWLINELRLHQTPYIAGAGVRVFDGVPPQQFESTPVRQASRVTHRTYRPLGARSTDRRLTSPR